LTDFDYGWIAGRERLLWEISHDVRRAKALFLHARAVNS